MMEKKKPVSGTKEWAAHSLNCSLGCSHGCLYCFGKANAVRFKRKTPETWTTEEINSKAVEKSYGKKKGTIMFPTAHDITPAILKPCLTVLKKLLKANNRLLIVSKPHLECVQAMCQELKPYKHKILFRFTICSVDDDVLYFWEPGAPLFRERLASLRAAHKAGFDTSVSCEPMLDNNVEAVVEAVLPFVTDAVWIGKVNKIGVRLTLNGANDEIKEAGRRLEASQNDARIREIYAKFKDNPKVKWKDSVKQVIGLDRPVKAGLDT